MASVASYKAMAEDNLAYGKAPRFSAMRKHAQPLSERAPGVIDEWMLVNGVDPSLVGSMDHTKAWWKCRTCGGEWRAAVYSRAMGSGCPYCSGRRVSAGLNDLATVDPELAGQWDYERNGSVKPQDVGIGSKRMTWWIVDGVHVRKSVAYMHGLKKKPVEVRMISESIAASRPDLMSEWDSRNTANPQVVSVYSNAAAWWHCENGHVWKARIANRANGSGCPYCSWRRAITGVNDLRTKRPDVMESWSDDNTLDPGKVTPGSNRKATWVCPKGHDYEMTIVNRCGHGNHCPVCNGSKLLKGYNDLATVRHDAARLWADDLNGGVHPCDVQSQSHRVFWWRCDRGHEWRDMVNGPLVCPECWADNRSAGETELYDAIVNMLPVAMRGEVIRNNRTVLAGRELDVYIPSMRLAFEYNGVYWHDEEHHDRHYHEDKWRDCKHVGVTLMQIWEDDWMNRRGIIMDHIQVLLHQANDNARIGARQCSVADVSAHDVGAFMDRYHIQGRVGGSIRKALMHDGVMVAAIICSRRNASTMVIERYATQSHTLVQGGFTKLLTSILRENTNIDTVLTFSDHSLSDGHLYSRNGFTDDGMIPADYSYVIHGNRAHKFGYRLSRFKSDPALKYVSGCSEKELARMNGIHWIWDAGKTRWLLKVKR
jgi:DNA-directed RNA polymerase subunit RPC12/RpoP